VTARVLIPERVKPGEVVEIRILIQHPMETGYRRDEVGNPIPRNTIRSMSCRYGGEEIFSAEMSPGIAANPLLQFTTVAQATGTLEFSWVDDGGHSEIYRRELIVAG
jgi:sulfur-oxidizing protein SoxZ